MHLKIMENNLTDENHLISGWCEQVNSGTGKIRVCLQLSFQGRFFRGFCLRKGKCAEKGDAGAVAFFIYLYDNGFAARGSIEIILIAGTASEAFGNDVFFFFHGFILCLH